MTRTPRKAALGLVAFATFALTVFSARDSRSEDNKAGAKPSPVDGAWRQVAQKNGNAQEYQSAPEGTEMIDYITGGRFVWTVVSEGRIVAAAGGKYKFDNDKFSEIIEYVHGDGVPASFVGSTFEFTCKLDGDTWHKVGTIKVNGQDFKIDEKWERCK